MSQANPSCGALQCEGVPWTAASFFVCRVWLLSRLSTVADNYHLFSTLFSNFFTFFHIYSFLLQLIVQTSLNNKEYHPMSSWLTRSRSLYLTSAFLIYVKQLVLWQFLFSTFCFQCISSVQHRHVWRWVSEIIKHFLTRPLDGSPVLPRMLIALWLIATLFLSLSHTVC